MLKAINRMIICRLETEEEKTSGGIFIPDSVKKYWNTAVVLSKGKDVTDEISIGDKVIVSGFQGADIEHKGTKYKTFKEDQIMAVICDS